MFKKRIIPVFLCLLLLVPLINYKEYEAYAMDLVITPFAAKCVLTGLVACGVGIASNSDADAIVNKVWSDMSSDLKKSILAMSSLKEGIEAGVSMWTSSVWSDFKDFTSSFFNSSGGNIVFTSVSANPLSTFSSYSSSSEMQFVSVVPRGNRVILPTGVPNFYILDEYTGGTYDVVLPLIPLGVENWYVSSTSSTYIYKNSVVIPLRVPAFVNGQFCIHSSANTTAGLYIREYIDNREKRSGYLFVDSLNRLVVSRSFSSEPYLVLMTGVPSAYTVAQAFESYCGLPITFDSSVSYSVDSVYYPAATGSICPDVPVNKVLSLPLVNDVVGVTAADVVGSATFTDVGAVDVPVDVPIVPPVDVPIVPPVDVPINTLDFTPLFALKIKNVFPFCIPFDLIKMVKIYSASPVEPNIGVHINNNLIKINHDIDLSLINFPLKFFRFSCIFTFIWILISNTKKLMKW